MENILQEIIQSLKKFFAKEKGVLFCYLFGSMVSQEGKLVFEREKEKRIDFELNAMNDYFDFKPILEMYHQRLLTS